MENTTPSSSAPANTAPADDNYLPPPSMDGPSSIEVKEAAAIQESIEAQAAAKLAAQGASGEPTEGTSNAPGVKALGEYFGLDAASLADEGKAAETLRPYIDQLIEAGSRNQFVPQASAPHVNAPPVAQQPAEEFKPIEIDFESEEFEDAPPSIVKAMKLLNQQANQQLKAAADREKAAAKAAADQKTAWEAQQQQQVNQQQQEVSRRAYDHVDKLNSPRFGVGQNRTLIQRIAVQEVMNTADNIIRGLQSFGGQTPTIEAIVDAALLRLNARRESPAPQQQPQQQVLPIQAYQRQPLGAPAPQQNRRGAGSAGQGGTLMNDAEYMAGARAILSR